TSPSSVPKAQSAQKGELLSDWLLARGITSLPALQEALKPRSPVAPPGFTFAMLKQAEVHELQGRKLWPLSAVIGELDELHALRSLPSEFYDAARQLEKGNFEGDTALSSAETDLLAELFPDRQTTEWWHIAST